MSSILLIAVLERVSSLWAHVPVHMRACGHQSFCVLRMRVCVRLCARAYVRVLAHRCDACSCARESACACARESSCAAQRRRAGPFACVRVSVNAEPVRAHVCARA
eukprot:3236304-Pleurochrysis_carterae.AAC.2